MGLIRLVLALSVVIWHIPKRTGAWIDASVAVLLFFVISGFYMALVIGERCALVERRGWRRQFYASRFFRIFPTYLVMVAVMVAWFWYTASPNVFGGGVGQAGSSRLLLVILNLAIIGQDFFEAVVNSVAQGEHNALAARSASAMPAGFFDAQFMLVGQAWSLASELLFYAAVPFVVRSLRRTLVLFAIGLGVRLLVIFGLGFSSHVWGYNFFPSTFCLFMLGSLGYHLYLRVKGWRGAGRIGAAALIAMAVFAAVSVARFKGVLLVDRATGFDTPRVYLAFVSFAAALPFIFALTRASKLDRMIGELSYPLYIVHGLVIGLVFFFWERPQGSLPWEIVAGALSVVAAAAMFLVVDLPVDRWRHRRFGAQVQPRLVGPQTSPAPT
jgi:peptidoglycan/LPS O-acetylase OafA/YrhL